MNEAKSWIFAKINKIDKALAKVRKKESNKIRNKRGDFTADTI